MLRPSELFDAVSQYIDHQYRNRDPIITETYRDLTNNNGNNSLIESVIASADAYGDFLLQSNNRIHEDDVIREAVSTAVDTAAASILARDRQYMDQIPDNLYNDIKMIIDKSNQIKMDMDRNRGGYQSQRNAGGYDNYRQQRPIGQRGMNQQSFNQPRQAESIYQSAALNSNNQQNSNNWPTQGRQRDNAPSQRTSTDWFTSTNKPNARTEQPITTQPNNKPKSVKKMDQEALKRHSVFPLMTTEEKQINENFMGNLDQPSFGRPAQQKAPPKIVLDRDDSELLAFGLDSIVAQVIVAAATNKAPADQDEDPQHWTSLDFADVAFIEIFDSAESCSSACKSSALVSKIKNGEVQSLSDLHAALTTLGENHNDIDVKIARVIDKLMTTYINDIIVTFDNMANIDAEIDSFISDYDDMLADWMNSPDKMSVLERMNDGIITLLPNMFTFEGVLSEGLRSIFEKNLPDIKMKMYGRSVAVLAPSTLVMTDLPPCVLGIESIPNEGTLTGDDHAILFEVLGQHIAEIGESNGICGYFNHFLVFGDGSKYSFTPVADSAGEVIDHFKIRRQR